MVLNIDLNALPMDEDVIFDVTSLDAISDQSGDNAETHNEVSKELKIEDQPEVANMAVDGGKDISYVKQSPQYLKERTEKVLRSRVVGIVKMLNHSKGRTTWEGEEDMRKRYPLLFQENKNEIKDSPTDLEIKESPKSVEKAWQSTRIGFVGSLLI